MPQFADIMTGKRYRDIKASLRFVPWGAKEPSHVGAGDVRFDRLWKTRLLLDSVNVAFRDVYIPGQCLALDEMMIANKSMAAPFVLLLSFYDRGVPCRLNRHSYPHSDQAYKRWHQGVRNLLSQHWLLPIHGSSPVDCIQ